MFPLRSDFEFWKSLQPVPKWAITFAAKPLVRVDIDSVVNAHGGIRVTGGENAAHNLIVFVRRYNRPGQSTCSLLDKLRYHATADTDKRRQRFARKWLARLERQNA